jgi:hypothetical protein
VGGQLSGEIVRCIGGDVGRHNNIQRDGWTDGRLERDRQPD